MVGEPSSSTDTSSGDGSSWVILNDEDNDIPSAQSLDAETPPTLPNQAPPIPDATSVTSTPVKEASASGGEAFRAFNIDDIETEADVQNLSVRQMKLLLTRNFVDYKGCCEKEELLDKVERLWRERKTSREQSNILVQLYSVCREINSMVFYYRPG